MRGPRSKTTEFNRRSAKFWTQLRATKVPMLRRAKVEDMILARAQAHPQSAKNELEFLKHVLHEAKGQRVEGAILEIPRRRREPRYSGGHRLPGGRCRRRPI
jgi:hypothetical protein